MSVPVLGCVLRSDRELHKPAHQAIVAREGRNLVALVLVQKTELVAYRGPNAGALVEIATATLDSGVSRMTALGERAETFVAFVDERGRVRLIVLGERSFSAPRTIAEGADRRFLPALARTDSGVVVAFTRTTEGAMHTFIARTAGPLELHDVTPESHGAAAPTFVLGANRALLVMIDARAGVSPLLEVPFDGEGKPLAAIVRTPVSQPYAPPLLGAVELANGAVHVAYTAIGRAAATAVGRVPLRTAREPATLSPSKGYGELTFSAARGEKRALFALEVPLAASAGAGRALELKVVDDLDEGPTLVVPNQGASLHRPSLTLGPESGTFVLVYTRLDAVRIAELACDA